MKQILRFSLILFFASCSQRPTESSVSQRYGDKFDTLNSMTVSELTSNLMGKSKMDCTIRGRTNEVCQSEGCWLTLKNSDGEAILVRMKNHSFKVPKDIKERFIYVKGSAVFETTSVELLRDYASDGGKSASEIQMIKEPKIQPVIEAEGVFLVAENESEKK